MLYDRFSDRYLFPDASRLLVTWTFPRDSLEHVHDCELSPLIERTFDETKLAKSIEMGKPLSVAKLFTLSVYFLFCIIIF